MDHVGEQRSPVTGRQFKGLSKDYAKFKRQEVGNSAANLEFSGDMLDALRVVRAKGNDLRVEVEGSEQNAKADGHNNHSGQSSLPRRPFIPNGEADERFSSRAIQDGIARIIAAAKERDNGG